MKNEVKYEWDYEETDEDGDIINHSHADKLNDFNAADKTGNLVLIRDVGNDADGSTDRLWAYVENGILPEYFSDSEGFEIVKVPAKFHNELKRHSSIN